MSLVRILLLAVAIYAGSTAIGALLLAPFRVTSPMLQRVVRPLGGFVLLPLLVWWWVEWLHRPARQLGWPIRVVVAAGVLVLVREWMHRRPSVGRARVFVRRNVPLVVVLGFFFVMLHPLAHQRAMTSSSDLDADAPFYSIVATSLLDDLPTADRAITDYDAHPVYRIDHHGAYGMLAATATTTGLRTVSIQWSVLIAAVLAMTQGMAGLVRTIFRTGWVGEVAAIAASVGSFLSVYMVALFPLGQVLGLSFIPAFVLTVIAAARARSTRALVGIIAAMWIAFDGIFRSYLFILPAFVPFALFAALASVRRPWRWRQHVGRPLVAMALAGAVTVVLAPDGAREQFRRFTRAADAPAGWSLPGFRPLGMLGFMRGFAPFAGWRRVALELLALLVVALVAVVAVRRERRRRFVFALAAPMAALGVYYLYYRSKGASYQQWKLAVSISFVAMPFFWVGFLEAARDGARRVTSRAPSGRAGWALAAAAVVVAAPLALVDRNGRLLHRDATVVIAHPETLALAARTPRSCAPDVQVASDDQVNENWLVYAFLDRKVRPIRLSYFGTQDQQELPTVWLASAEAPGGIAAAGSTPLVMTGRLSYDAWMVSCATGR
jgi:hypothetical protein